jgi:hypothetical protein
MVAFPPANVIAVAECANHHEACSELRINILVRQDWYAVLKQRYVSLSADQSFVAFVLVVAV